MPRLPEWDRRVADSLLSTRIMAKRIISLEKLETACQSDTERGRIRADRQTQEAMLLSYLTHVEQGLASWRRVVDGWSLSYGKSEPSIRQLKLIVGGLEEESEAA